MTEVEFRRLKCGDFITYPGNMDDKIYQIVQEDVWGPPKLVFLAQLVEHGLPSSTEHKYIQNSERNYQFWQRKYIKGLDLLRKFTGPYCAYCSRHCLWSVFTRMSHLYIRMRLNWKAV